jgi:hypothetical protein
MKNYLGFFLSMVEKKQLQLIHMSDSSSHMKGKHYIHV